MSQELIKASTARFNSELLNVSGISYNTEIAEVEVKFNKIRFNVSLNIKKALVQPKVNIKF